MARTKNINNLSQDDICKFYEFVCQYELEVKYHFGDYNFDANVLRQFCINNNIVFGKRKASPYRFVFEANKPKDKQQNDKAHHLLRHIRNAFCHGLVRKEGKLFILTDRNKNGNESMNAKIWVDLFWSLIDILLKTKK